MPRHRAPSPAPYSRSASPSRQRSLSAHPQPKHKTSSSPPAQSDLGNDVLKTSLVFLGAIGAASYAASKYWPKGILYGDKESWAHEVKEGVKHAVGHGDGRSEHRQHRRHRSVGYDDPDTRRRRQARVEVRDEFVATKPDGRKMYVDAGWDRHSGEERNYYDRRRNVG
ncbi:hypothetical protein F4819DRAFT_151231 [Hypoxylon fuscum]|nr:hypothetical protein F4819DRAFT_151231 [Hypoxylon fuscum]